MVASCLATDSAMGDWMVSAEYRETKAGSMKTGGVLLSGVSTGLLPPAPAVIIGCADPPLPLLPVSPPGESVPLTLPLPHAKAPTDRTKSPNECRLITPPCPPRGRRGQLSRSTPTRSRFVD